MAAVPLRPLESLRALSRRTGPTSEKGSLPIGGPLANYPLFLPKSRLFYLDFLSSRPIGASNSRNIGLMAPALQPLLESSSSTQAVVRQFA